MRKINLVIIHCAATSPEMDVGVKEIRQWHLDRGFTNIGYHYVIRRNGNVEKGRQDSVVGSHAKGFNANSIGVCLVGGVKRVNGKLYTENNFTEAQFKALKELLSVLNDLYPTAKILGHRDVDKGKDCPSFSIRDFLIANGIEREWA